MTKILDWKRITIYVTPQEHRALRYKLVKLDTSMSEYIRKLVVQALSAKEESTEE